MKGRRASLALAISVTRFWANMGPTFLLESPSKYDSSEGPTLQENQPTPPARKDLPCGIYGIAPEIPW
jgi:hypothetical protein